MTATPSRRARRLAWIVALVTLAVGGALVRLVEQRRTDFKRRDARDAAMDLGRRLQQELTNSLSAAQVVAAFLKETGHVDRFKDLAAELKASRSSMESVQLAPDGRVSQVEPREAGEVPLDPDLAKLARESRRPVLRPLAREGRERKLLGVLPVFLPGDGGRERVWGFVTVVVEDS